MIIYRLSDDVPWYVMMDTLVTFGGFTFSKADTRCVDARRNLMSNGVNGVPGNITFLDFPNRQPYKQLAGLGCYCLGYGVFSVCRICWKSDYARFCH